MGGKIENAKKLKEKNKNHQNLSLGIRQFIYWLISSWFSSLVHIYIVLIFFQWRYNWYITLCSFYSLFFLPKNKTLELYCLITFFPLQQYILNSFPCPWRLIFTLVHFFSNFFHVIMNKVYILWLEPIWIIYRGHLYLLLFFLI